MSFFFLKWALQTKNGCICRCSGLWSCSRLPSHCSCWWSLTDTSCLSESVQHFCICDLWSLSCSCFLHRAVMFLMPAVCAASKQRTGLLFQCSPALLFCVQLVLLLLWCKQMTSVTSGLRWEFSCVAKGLCNCLTSGSTVKHSLCCLRR